MAYNAGTAVLQVVPSFRNIERNIARAAREMGAEFRKELMASLPKAMGEAMEKAASDVETNAAKASEKIAEGRARSIAQITRRGLDEQEQQTSRSVKKQGDIYSGLAELRRKIAEKELREYDRNAAERARRAAREAAEEIRRAGDTQRQVDTARARAAAEADKAFARTFGGRAQAGARAGAATIPVALDTQGLRGEMQRLRAAMAGLGDLTIGVNIDQDDFLDQTESLFGRLRQIAHDTEVDIDVRTDAAGAATELGAILAMANRIDAADAEVDINTNHDRALAGLLSMAQAAEVNLSRLGMLVALGATLGTAIVPAAAAATAAIGAIGTAALAAMAGIGVMTLGLGGIGEAVKALGKAEEDAAKAAKSNLSSQNQIANALDGVRSAEAALANTRANNRDAAVSANRAVELAIRQVARAREAAAQDEIEAARRVQDAQRDLERDEIDLLRAREDLNQAYRDAKRAFEDLQSSIKRNTLDQRQAILDIKEAKEELDKIIGNPRATDEEREQAQINYERRVQELEDVKRRQQELQEQQEKNARTGIEGSDQVVQARERVIDAERRVADTQRRLALALENVERTRIEGAERIADAEERVADAERARERQRRQAAYAERQAAQAIISAQRSLQNAYATTATAGGAAMDNLNTAMSKLSPTAQRFARYIYGLKDEFLALRAAAADSFLPGLQQAIELLRPALPALTDFVGRVGVKLGELFVRFARSLRDPIFQRFFDYISTTAVPTLDNLYQITTNLLRGFIGLFLGFTPLSDDVTGGVLRMSEAFAKWAENLDQNKGFQAFLQYLRENGPRIGELLKQIGTFMWRFIVAAAPIGEKVVDGFIWLFEILNKIPTETLTTIIAGIGGLAAAIGILAAGTAVAGLGIAAAIAAAVAAIAVGLVILYQKVEPFRRFVTTAFDAVGKATVWLVQNIFIPYFQRMGQYLRFVWENSLSPIFEVMKSVLRTVASTVMYFYNEVWRPIFTAAVAVLKNLVFPVINFFWTHAIKPIFGYIGIALKVLGAAFQVFWGLIQIGVKVAGASIKLLYQVFVKPTWDLIKIAVGWLGDFWNKHLRDKWEAGVKVLGGIFDKLREKTKAPIRWIVETALNNTLLAGYNKLAKFFNVEPDDVKIDLPKGFATGGALTGPGTGTSDSFLIRASNGEHMWTAKEVQAAGGHDAMYAMRRAVLQGHGHLPGFRTGGSITDGVMDWLRRTASSAKNKATDVFDSAKNFFRDPMDSLKKIAETVLKKLPNKDGDFGRLLTAIPLKMVGWLQNKFLGTGDEGSGGSGTAGKSALGGSAGMMRILRAVFPGLRLISGFRPGAITATGNPSMHGKNRAVDLPPRMDVFNWIRQNYPRSHELIFSPAGGRQLYRGMDHVFSGITKRMHYDHVHWSYDQGGWLPDTRQMPGQVMSLFHGRRQPDAVLTNSQWNNVSSIVREMDRRGDAGATYNFEFANSTLTPERLASIQARRDALDRINRPNW